MSKPSPASYLFKGTGTTGMPDATVCGQVGQFSVIGLQGIAPFDPFTVQWSALADPSDWPTPATDDARTKQAGKQVLSSEYGKVTGIAGNDFYGYVFQQRAITKMTYVGGDVVFSFDTFEEGRGCIDYERFAQIDDLVIFQSEFGHHALQNDQIADIGRGFIDKTYPPSVGTEQDDVAVNLAINTVFFGDNDLAYNYKTNQWTRIPAFAGNGYYSLDSASAPIGQIVWSGYTVDFQESTAAASQAATATFVTGEVDLNAGGRAIVDSTRPLHDGASVSSVRIGVRDLPSDSVTWCTGTALNSRTGQSNFRGGANTPEGRYHRAEFVFTGGFTTVKGADFEWFPAGDV